jgi:hypothetical protein
MRMGRMATQAAKLGYCLVEILHCPKPGRQSVVTEVLVEFSEPVVSEEGSEYVARACGRPKGDGLWEGWIEFLPVGKGEAVRSGRETTQPNRQDTLYWATGLTEVYLEGALHRALKPLVRKPPRAIPGPIFDGPAPDTTPAPRTESILNPFSVYRKGEALLRRQLGAMSAWHLVNIVRAHNLSNLDPAVLNMMTEPTLVELIVAAVRVQEETPASK